MYQLKIIKRLFNRLAKNFLCKIGLYNQPEYINGFLIDPDTRKLVASYADAPRVLELLNMMALPEKEYNEYKKYIEKIELTYDPIRLHRFQKSILHFLFINEYVLQNDIEKKYYLELNKVSIPSQETIEDFLKSIIKLYNNPDYENK